MVSILTGHHSPGTCAGVHKITGTVDPAKIYCSGSHRDGRLRSNGPRPTRFLPGSDGHDEGQKALLPGVVRVFEYQY